MISQLTIQAARELMKAQTDKNGAPAWPLTEIAAAKGQELATKHNAREDIVVLALYLAHSVFSKEIGGDVQKKHPALSADFADDFLGQHGVAHKDRRTVVSAIQAHHAQIPTKSLEAEIVKNAEGFKFLTLAGAKYFIANLQERGMTIDQAKKELERKMDQKFSYLTLAECIKEAKDNMAEIQKSIN